jgi:hypothetical protein
MTPLAAGQIACFRGTKIPNICANYLKLSGNEEAARQVLQNLRSGGFGAFIPEPLDAGKAGECQGDLDIGK